MLACLAALVLWTGFGQPFWAHMPVVAAVPVSFWPTWASVAAEPLRERSAAWGWWTIGDLATLLFAGSTADENSIDGATASAGRSPPRRPMPARSPA